MEQFDQAAQEIIDQFGCIPPRSVLYAKQFFDFLNRVKTYGPSLSAIRKRFDVLDVIFTSVDGQNWDSFCEVNVANMLLIRGFSVTKGRRYAAAFSEQYPRNNAWYDLHFTATSEAYAGKEISCEIWGGPKHCWTQDNIDRYAQTKAFKVDFHKESNSFLGIDYTDCYNDQKILHILLPYIDKAAVLPSWAAKLPPVAVVALPVYDRVLEESEQILQKLGTTELPAMAWFWRAGCYANRTIHAWEPDSWSPYAKRLGMVKITVVRRALGGKVRKTWTKESIVEEMVAWYKTHNASPKQIILKINQMSQPTAEDLELKQCASLLSYAACNHWRMGDLNRIISTRLVAAS